MVPINASIGGRPIMATGSVIGRIGENVDLFPFVNFPDYCIRFIHRCVAEGPDNTTNIYLARENLVHMELTHKWSFPNRVTVTRSVFANDQTTLYCINYFVDFMGDINNYTFVYNYTIFSEPSQ